MLALELRRIEMQLKAPAAGLMVVAFLNLAFWCTMGFTLAYEGWDMQHGLFTGSRAEVFGAAVAAGVVLLVVATIIQGARHMRRLTGMGWCYSAAILVLIPWAATSIVGFFVGIWVLNVLSRPEVKEAFVQRSLELDRRG